MGRQGVGALFRCVRNAGRLTRRYKMITYSTKGTCSKQIIFDLDEENRIHNVKFIGGCSGNLQGISKLVDGKTPNEVVPLLRGIRCKQNTSCPDQLAQALEPYVK